MADRDALRALAERVMALTGPDRETFMAAFDACHPMPPPDCEPAWRAENPKQPIYHAWKTRQLAFIKFVSAEAWLCAAELLVPEGAWWWVEAQPLIHGKFWAGCGNDRVSTAATPALALTAAALLALAEEVPE